MKPIKNNNKMKEYQLIKAKLNRKLKGIHQSRMLKTKKKMRRLKNPFSSSHFLSKKCFDYIKRKRA
jgi:hypothetical protein